MPTLYSIENYGFYENLGPMGSREWKAWRVVAVDPSSGAVAGKSGWTGCFKGVLHPWGGCGSTNRPLGVLYNGDYQTKPTPRSVLLLADGSSFDMVKSAAGSSSLFADSGAVVMHDGNDGFQYAVSVDPHIKNQVSLYDVNALTGRPVSLDHIATVVLPPQLYPPRIALATGCGIKMGGGCNIPQSLLYASVQAVDGGLFVVARDNGTVTRVPVAGIPGYGAEGKYSGTGFTSEAMWVDLAQHPPREVFLAGYDASPSVNSTIYRVDVATGASQVVLQAKLGPLRGCAAYDDAARIWYLGCERIFQVSVDSWTASSGTVVQHEDGNYRLSGLELLLDHGIDDPRSTTLVV